MAKKTKTYKLEQNEIKNAESFRSYFDNFSVDASNSARYVDFEITNTKENYRITAVADYGAFKVEYFYYPSMYLFSSNFIDFRIVYDNCDYKFSIYDIFNLFDIKDFSKYYFEECCTKEEIRIVLDKLTQLVEKYKFDIEKASEPSYFDMLVSNFENDWRTSYKGDDDDEWKEELNDDFILDAVHPSFTLPDVSIEKLYKKLKKNSAKNKLDTLYERRLLEYLDSGFTPDTDNEKSDYDKAFRKNFLRSIAVIYAVCIAVVAVIALVARHFIFNYSVIINDTYTIFGKEIYASGELILGIFISGLFLGMTSIDVFGKKMYVLLTKDNSERAKQRFEMSISDNFKSKFLGKTFLHLGAVVTFVLAIGCAAFVVCDNAALADDYVKYPALTQGLFCTVDYDELQVYSVETHWDDDEEDYVKYDNPAYAFSNPQGDYYEVGEVLPDSKAGKLLAQKIEEHNIKVENIKSIEVLDHENSGN